MSETLYLTPTVRLKLHATCMVQRPFEACGFIVADKAQPDLGVRVIPILNAAENPRCQFKMAEGEQVRATHWVDERGLILLAVYHSHVDSPALLSDRDLTEPNDLDPLQVVLSLKDVPIDVRAYRITQPFIGVRGFERVPIEIIDPGAAGG